MATWASTTQTSSFDAEQFARNSIESRNSARSGASVSGDFGQKSFLGIKSFLCNCCNNLNNLDIHAWQNPF